MAKTTKNAELMAQLEELKAQMAQNAELMAQMAQAQTEMAQKLEAEKNARLEAEKKEAEMAGRLEEELRKTDTAQFDASIKVNFDFARYAMPGFTRTKYPATHIKPAIRIRESDLVVRDTVKVPFNAMFLLPGKYDGMNGDLYRVRTIRTMTDKEIGQYVRAELRRAEYEANRPEYIFDNARIRSDVKLPEVKTAVTTSTKTATKKAKNARKTAAGAVAVQFDVNDFNKTFTADERANNRLLEPVARGYMLKEAGKPIVRVFVTRNGFKIARRANHSMIAILPDTETLEEALHTYTLARADEWK